MDRLQVFLNFIAPYTKRNAREGFPQLNCIEHCLKSFPHHAKRLKAASVNLKSSNYSDEAIKEFFEAWRLPCREMRIYHANQQ